MNMKNNKQAREQFFEAIQKALKDVYGAEMPLEKIGYLSKVTEQMIERAKEGFVCSNCKSKYKLVVLNKNEHEN